MNKAVCDPRNLQSMRDEVQELGEEKSFNNCDIKFLAFQRVQFVVVVSR